MAASDQQRELVNLLTTRGFSAEFIEKVKEVRFTTRSLIITHRKLDDGARVWTRALARITVLCPVDDDDMCV